MSDFLIRLVSKTAAKVVVKVIVDLVGSAIAEGKNPAPTALTRDLVLDWFKQARVSKTTARSVLILSIPGENGTEDLCSVYLATWEGRNVSGTMSWSLATIRPCLKELLGTCEAEDEDGAKRYWIPIDLSRRL